MRKTFVERTLAGMLDVIERAGLSETSVRGAGLLQRVDARVKLPGVVALMIGAALARNLATIAALLVLAAAAAIASAIPLRILGRIWAGALFFAGIIALPALFITPGAAVTTIGNLTVTMQGLRAAAFLAGRVTTAATLGFTLAATTRWPLLLAALRAFRLPAAVVLVVAMTYRYVFVLLRAAEEMFVARRSRAMAPLPAGERRRIATATAGVLLAKSLAMSDEVYLAMRARGFRGEVHVLDRPALGASDWLAAVVFGAAASVVIAWGLR